MGHANDANRVLTDREIGELDAFLLAEDGLASVAHIELIALRGKRKVKCLRRQTPALEP
jgi:hypothetical protein